MFFANLRKKFLTGSFLVMLMASLCGCVYIVVGGLGALGGYVVSPDTVEGVIEGRSFEDVWSAAMETVSVMGLIKEKAEAGGLILADIQGTKVTITIARLSPQAIRVTVKARRAFWPKIKLAQDIFVKISNFLE